MAISPAKLDLGKDVLGVVKKLSSYREVVAIYLFGSHARGEPRPTSDVDICVMLEPGSESLETEIGGYSSPRIDTSMWHRLPLIIKFRVLKEGRLLHVGNPKQLHEIQVATLRAYHDYAPVIERRTERILAEA
jgi:hypothetical protein